MDINSTNLKKARERVYEFARNNKYINYTICIECEKLLCEEDMPQTRYAEPYCPYCKSYDNLIDLAI